MKIIKFRGIRQSNGKMVKGYWLAAERPNRAQTVAERILRMNDKSMVNDKLLKFVSVCIDKKETMIKCEESE